MVCGENFPNILQGRQHALFRELYRRTLHYLLDGAKALDGEIIAAPRDSTVIDWGRLARIGAVLYELPEFIDFGDPQWHRKAARYATYVIAGSADGEHSI